VSIVGTDLATIVRSRCEAAGTIDPVVVPISFVERVKLMPEGPLTIAIEKGAAVIASGKRRFKLDTMAASGFPAALISEPTEDEIDAAPLAFAITNGAASMSLDQSRSNMYGARFVEKTVRSMDGNQLSIVPSPIDIDAMLPPPAVSLIGKFLDASEMVSVGIDGGRVVIARKDALISCATTDGGAFPDFKLFFANVDACAPTMTIDRLVLTDMVRAVSAAASADTRTVEVTATGGEIQVNAGTRGEDTASCEIDGRISFGVSAHRLLSVLNATDGDHVRIQNAGNMAPIVVMGLTTKHVVMPVWPDHVRAAA
jgi:DNA polymerase III sliding clamp (beta) subunit (PCNA family)